MEIENSYEKKSMKSTLKKYEKYCLKHKSGKFAVYMIEICDLKFYNYIFGYEESYTLFQTILEKVRKKFQDKFYIFQFMDCRFVVVAEQLSRNDVYLIEKEIFDVFRRKFYVKNQKIVVHVKIGVSLYPDDSEDLFKVLRYSDIALSYAKENNKIEYEVFNKSMYDEILRKQRVISEIGSALSNKELILFYQPQVNLKNMEVYGFEALIRWNHPVRGILSPMYFIDIIEQNGMINDVGKFVIYEACRQLQEWHTSGYPNISMSINISESQINGQEFLNFVKYVLEKTGVETKFLIFEITERIVLGLNEEKLNLIKKLKDIGIRIFIDDFGTKYSNLDYLNALPVDGIKIDKCFIDRLEYSQKDLAITKNIISLAHELNLEVIAEGVEKQEQLKYLSNMKCGKVQGFIFQKPISSNEVDNFLKNFKV